MSPEAAAAAAVGELSSLGPIEVSSAVGADLVTVTATYVDPTDVPLIGVLLPDVEVSSSSTMILEPP